MTGSGQRLAQVHVIAICCSPLSYVIVIPFYAAFPGEGSPLPSPTSPPSISPILPFLSCQFLVDAMGHCFTFWRDSTIHRGAKWEFTSHGGVFPSICYNVRSLHCSAGGEGKIMASTHSLLIYYTLTASDLVCSIRCTQIFFVRLHYFNLPVI